MAWTRKKALKDVTISAVSQYAVLALVVLRGFLFTKYLGPEGFGAWASIYLLFTYGQYSHLGILNSVAYLLPETIGKGETDKTNRLLSSAITWMNIFGILFFAFIVTFTLTGFSEFFQSNRLAVMLAALSVPLIFNFNFSVYRFQFSHEYKRAGIFQVCLAVMDVTVSFVLLKLFGLPGAYLGMIISLAVFTGLILKDGYRDLYICFDKEVFKKLFGVGFKVLLVSFSFAVLTTSDKLSVTSFFSKIDMGYFSNAVAFAMMPYTIAMALNGITTQRMLEEYGRTQEIKSIKLFLDENIFAVAFLVPLFSVLLVAFAEPLIYLVLPKYVSSLRYVDKLSVGVYFLAISMCCYSFLLILKKYMILFLLLVSLIAVVLASNYIVSVMGYGLIGVSFVSVMNYVAFAFILYFITYRNFYSLKKIIWMFFRLSLPVIPVLIAFSMKFYLFDTYVRFGARLVIALFWGLFAYYYLMRKTTILSQLIAMIKNKIL